MRIVIHPRYTHLEEFIRRIPGRAYRPQRVFRERRNRVETVETPTGKRLVVKAFGTFGLFQRLLYTIRPSKARRSFEYSLRLEEKGIATAPPVAWIETRRSGLFEAGYFISEFVPETLMDTIESYDEPKRGRLIIDFAAFTAELHRKRICHRDYNLSNVFFRPCGEGYAFRLIDVNRTRFKHLSKRDCLRELTRLQHISLPTAVAIVGEYARVRGWNEELCCAGMLLERNLGRRARFKRLHRFLKRLFSTRKKIIPEMTGR